MNVYNYPTGPVIRLGAEGTRAYQSIGLCGDEFRATVRAKAIEVLRSTGKTVEIYACERAGGYMFARITGAA